MAKKKLDPKAKDAKKQHKIARTTANKARRAAVLARRIARRSVSRTSKTPAGTRRAALRKSGEFFKRRKEARRQEAAHRLDTVVTINGQPMGNLRSAVLYCRQLAEEKGKREKDGTHSSVA